MGKFRDLTGERYGAITVICDPGERSKSGSVVWKVRCDCGSVFNVARPEKILSCGCEQHPVIGKPGMRFGRWTLVEQVESRKGGNGSVWRCKCDCGEERDVRYNTMSSGGSTSCGCLRDEILRGPRKDYREVATNLLYRQYSGQAKKRDLVFELTKDEFSGLILQNCYYCGAPPSNLFKKYQRDNSAGHEFLLYNGIDRIDNSSGYVSGNCVPCCIRCNQAKRDMSFSQFKSWVKSVYFELFSGISHKSVGLLVDDLTTTNIKCFLAQDEIFEAKLSGDNDLVAELAVKTSRLNARRNELMRAIDEALGFNYSVTEKTYDGK